MTVQQFEGASAIVSGGAGGLGEATVRRLHADGLGVVIADLAADKGKALADELGSRALFVSTDVTSEDSILGAIGVTSEHPLWLFTLRAQSWTGDYGTTASYARRLGRLVLAAEDPWGLVTGDVTHMESNTR